MLRLFFSRVGTKVDVTKNSYILTFLTILTAVVICVGSPLLYHFELGQEGANIKGYGDALWLSLMSITTIGFGDHYPVSTEGRMVTGFIAFVGATLYCTLVGYIGGMVIAHTQRETRNEELKEQNSRIEELSKTIEDMVQKNMAADAEAARIDQEGDAKILQVCEDILKKL